MLQSELDRVVGVIRIFELGEIVSMLSWLSMEVEYTNLLGRLEGMSTRVSASRVSVRHLVRCLTYSSDIDLTAYKKTHH